MQSRNTANAIERAFTLIELLIVVAIIAILAAIATPNFLEAQTRSKVSRVKSDHRTIAIALESYFTDWGAYPRDQDNSMDHPAQYGFRLLTTPVPYLTGRTSDPFSDKSQNSKSENSRIAPAYVLASGSDAWRNQVRGESLYPIVHCWTLISIGPNRQDDASGQDDFPFATNYGAYDPTNGTVSAGDILRFGGSYRAGNWRLNKIPYQQWSFGDVLP